MCTATVPTRGTLIGVSFVQRNAEGKLPTCDSCGHEIAGLYEIALPSGAHIQVGSDCCVALLGLASDVDRARRWGASAKREWLRAAPAKLGGETRDQYLNRRLIERGNARAAWNHILSLGRNGLSPHVKRNLAERGVVDPFWQTEPRPRCDDYYHLRTECPACIDYERRYAALEERRCGYGALLLVEAERIVSETERRFGANRHDFMRTLFSARRGFSLPH